MRTVWYRIIGTLTHQPSLERKTPKPDERYYSTCLGWFPLIMNVQADDAARCTKERGSVEQDFLKCCPAVFAAGEGGSSKHQHASGWARPAKSTTILGKLAEQLG